MSLAVQRPTFRLLLLAATLALATTFTYSFSSAATGSSPQPTGLLEVDDVAYRFAPTTCAVADNDFVSSGSGELDGDSFWVSASSDRVSLAVGADHRIEEPTSNQLWLTSVERIDWQNNGGSIVGSVTLRDERNPDATSVVGRLSVSCPTL